MAARSQIESAYLKIMKHAVEALRRPPRVGAARKRTGRTEKAGAAGLFGLLGPVRGPERQGASEGRTNWRTVLEQLPKEFKASRRAQGSGTRRQGVERNLRRDNPVDHGEGNQAQGAGNLPARRIGAHRVKAGNAGRKDCVLLRLACFRLAVTSQLPRATRFESPSAGPLRAGDFSRRRGNRQAKA